MVPTSNIQGSNDVYLKYEKYMTYLTKNGKADQTENQDYISRKIRKNIAKIKKFNVVRPINTVRTVNSENRGRPKKATADTEAECCPLNHDIMETVDHMMNTIHEQVTKNDSANYGARSITSVLLKGKKISNSSLEIPPQGTNSSAKKERNPEEIKGIQVSGKFNSKQAKNLSSLSLNNCEKEKNTKKPNKLNTSMKLLDKDTLNMTLQNMKTNSVPLLKKHQLLPNHIDNVVSELCNVLFHASKKRKDGQQPSKKQNKIGDIFKTTKKSAKKIVTKHKHSVKTKKSPFKSKNVSSVTSVTVIEAKTISKNNSIPSRSLRNSPHTLNEKKKSHFAKKASAKCITIQNGDKKLANTMHHRETTVQNASECGKGLDTDPNNSYEVSVDLQAIIKHLTNVKQNKTALSNDCEYHSEINIAQNLFQMSSWNQSPIFASSVGNNEEITTKTGADYYSVEEMSNISERFRNYEEERHLYSNINQISATVTRPCTTKMENTISYNEHDESLDNIETIFNHSSDKDQKKITTLNDSCKVIEQITEEATTTTVEETKENKFNKRQHYADQNSMEGIKQINNMELKNYFNHKLKSLSNKFQEISQMRTEGNEFVQNNSKSTHNILKESEYRDRFAYNEKNNSVQDMIRIFNQTKSTDTIKESNRITPNSKKISTSMLRDIDSFKKDKEMSKKTTNIDNNVVPDRSNDDDSLQLRSLECCVSSSVYTIRTDEMIDDSSSCFYSDDNSGIADNFGSFYEDLSDDGRFDELTDIQDNTVFIKYLDLIDSPSENNTPRNDISNLDNSEILNQICHDSNKYFLQSPQILSQHKSELQKDEESSATNFANSFNESDSSNTTSVSKYDNNVVGAINMSCRHLLGHKSIEINGNCNNINQTSSGRFENDFVAKEFYLRNLKSSKFSSDFENSSASICFSPKDEIPLDLLTQNAFNKSTTSANSFSNVDIHRGMFENVNQAGGEDNLNRCNDIYSKIEDIDLVKIKEEYVNENYHMENIIQEIISFDSSSLADQFSIASEIINSEEYNMECIASTENVEEEIQEVETSNESIDISPQNIEIEKKTLDIPKDLIEIPEDLEELQKKGSKVLVKTEDLLEYTVEIEQDKLNAKEESIISDEKDKSLFTTDPYFIPAFNVTRITEIPDIENRRSDNILEEAQKILNKINAETVTRKRKIGRGSKFEITFNESGNNISIEIGETNSSQESSSVEGSNILEHELSDSSCEKDLRSKNDQYSKVKVSSSSNSFDQNTNFANKKSDKILKSSDAKENMHEDESDGFEFIEGHNGKYFPGVHVMDLIDDKLNSTSTISLSDSSSSVCRFAPSNYSSKTVVHRSDSLYIKDDINANLIEPDNYSFDIPNEGLLYAVLKRRQRRHLYTAAKNFQKKIRAPKKSGFTNNAKDLLLFLVYAAVFMVVFGALRLNPPLCLN